MLSRAVCLIIAVADFLISDASRIGVQQLRNFTSEQHAIAVTDTSELEHLQSSSQEGRLHEIAEHEHSSSAEQQAESNDHDPVQSGDDGFMWTSGEVDVVVENLSGFRISKLVIIHKYLGLQPPTHVMEFENLAHGATSDVRKFSTIVGAMALRQDWWMATWTYEKQRRGGCIPCEKADGTCGAWLSASGSTLMRTMLDPMTYAKAAITATSIAISAASAGTATAVAVALGGMLTDKVASAILSEDNVDGFMHIGIKQKTLEDSGRGTPLKIVILPEDAGLEEAMAAPAKMIIQQGRADGKGYHESLIPVRAMKCDSSDRKGEPVSVRLNTGAKPILTAALLHRNQGLSPSLEIMKWKNLAAGKVSGLRRTMTKTGKTCPVKRYNDMWLLSWVHADEECIVRTIAPKAYIQQIYDAPEFAAYQGLTRGANALIGQELSIIGAFATHARSHYTDDPTMTSFGWSRDVEELFGKEAIFHLAGTEDEQGMKKCNLCANDLEGTGPVDVVLPASDDGDVVFKWHEGRACKATVKKSCKPTPECASSPQCASLK